jgi:acetolactate synthase-1/2/3 large subunit
MKEPHLIDDGPVNLYAVADTLSDLLTGDETILTDSGCSFYVMGQAFRCKQNERYIVSGALGAMGYVLPAAIGVATADPNRTIVCVTGEGALQMNVQELQTLRQEQFNVKLIIINNDGYASIRSTQKSFFDGYFVGSDRTSGLSTPSLQKLADAYELSYVHCPDAVHLRECLRRTLSSPGPVMCDVSCQFDQQIIPSVTSVRLPDGRMESKDLQDMFPFLVQQVGEQELRKTDG